MRKKISFGAYSEVYILNQFDLLKKNNIESIQLFYLNKTKIIKNKNDIYDLLDIFSNSINIMVKIIKTNIFYIKKEQIKKLFYRELRINKKLFSIYKKNINNYLTIDVKLKFKKLKLLGCIINEYNKQYFMIFSNKCDDKFKINLDQYINDILKSIIILQKNNLKHNDIKLNNSVKCGNKYKLIDFANMESINNINFITSYGINKSPISLLLYFENFTYTDILFYIEKYLTPLFQSQLWLDNLSHNNNFKKVFDKIIIEFKYIISKKYDKKFLINKYKYTFDIYMLGITIFYIVHKYKLNFNKYKEIIYKFTSIINPPKNAIEAFRFIYSNKK